MAQVFVAVENIILGIDPGVNGAICQIVVTDKRVVFVDFLPLKNTEEVYHFLSKISSKGYANVFVFIEKIQMFQTQSVAIANRMCTLLHSYWLLFDFCKILCIDDIVEASPRTWQKLFALQTLTKNRYTSTARIKKEHKTEANAVLQKNGFSCPTITLVNVDSFLIAIYGLC